MRGIGGGIVLADVDALDLFGFQVVKIDLESRLFNGDVQRPVIRPAVPPLLVKNEVALLPLARCKDLLLEVPGAKLSLDPPRPPRV